MWEVELKARLTQHQAEQLPACLLQLQFSETQRVLELDEYFNAPDRDFCRTDEALRLRSAQNLQTQKRSVTLNYKGPKVDTVSSTRAEYEIAVRPYDTASGLLRALGYRSVFQVEKIRTYYQRGDLNACLDCVTHLGPFLELELLTEQACDREAAVEKLYGLLDMLDVPRSALTRRSYLELLLAETENGPCRA